MSWISFNAQFAIASGAVKFDTKPLSIDQCIYNFEHYSNTTESNISLEYENHEYINYLDNLLKFATLYSEVSPIYRISYMWFTFLGSMITIGTSAICTIFFGSNNPSQVDKKLLTPCIRKFFKDNSMVNK